MMADSERSAETGDAAEREAERLEAALARIARAAPGGPPALLSGTAAEPALRARLDALIADIRAALGRDSPD